MTEYGLSRSSPQRCCASATCRRSQPHEPTRLRTGQPQTLASVSRPRERQVEVGKLAIETGPSSARTRAHPADPPHEPDGTSQPP
ncbi:hypothetical protein C0Q63_31615 [Streptomyces albidoflavus]|nr:hypothetical protein C0Q63_31615 [Streptomyces albidoflavus]